MDECVRLVKELCEGGIIGFDAEFTKNSESTKLIALLQFVITFPVTPLTCSAPAASTHNCASPLSSPPSASANAAATPTASTNTDPGPAHPCHATNGATAADICGISASQPALEQQPNKGIPAAPQREGRCLYRRPPCVFLFRLSKLGYVLTESLIGLLKNPALLWVTVNFKAGDGPSLRRTLLENHTEPEVQAMGNLMAKQFDLDIMTHRGVANWGSALLGYPWGKRTLDSRHSWVVSVHVNLHTRFWPSAADSVNSVFSYSHGTLVCLHLRNVAKSWLRFTQKKYPRCGPLVDQAIVCCCSAFL